jgi:F-type H+-transporting ATPase subunit a
MHEGHGFLWYQQFPFLAHLPAHVVHACFVGLLMVVTMTIARFSLSSAMASKEGALVPPSTLTYRNFFEILAERLFGLCESVLGLHEAKAYYPFIGTLFCYIFFSNLLGSIPGFLPPTDNLNTTLALGVFVFIYYNIMGIRENGLINHLKHFMGPVWWLAWLIIPIELVSHLVRPLSLGLRLRGNISGDHIVLGVFNDLVPYGVPVIFLGLGLFVAFVQAFVFCLLTMVYISLATAHDH